MLSMLRMLRAFYVENRIFSIGLERPCFASHFVINQINHGVGFTWAESVEFSNPNKMYDVYSMQSMVI